MSFLVNPFLFAPTGDLYFANVVLLCHFDGADGSTTIIDNSPKAHTLTVGTGVVLTTAQQKFGTASLQCGAASSYASCLDSPDWAFGSGQFTVEAWVRPTAAISGARAVVCQWATATNRSWHLGFIGTALAFTYSLAGTDVPAVSATYSPTLNQWMHIAADRDVSNVLRVYADGVVIASATVASTFFDSTLNLRIGNDSSVAQTLSGQVDDLRITKGIARYAGAFTPPTSAFPDS